MQMAGGSADFSQQSRRGFAETAKNIAPFYVTQFARDSNVTTGTTAPAGALIAQGDSRT